MKQEEKLYNALKSVLYECVDEMGLPKKPTVKTLYKANKARIKYEYEVKRREEPIVPIPEINNNEGGEKPEEYKICDNCDGERYTFFVDQGEPDPDTICRKCNGTGKIFNK